MILHHCKNGKMCPFYKYILSIDDWESIDCLENASGKIKLHDLRLLAVPSTFESNSNDASSPLLPLDVHTNAARYMDIL